MGKEQPDLEALIPAKKPSGIFVKFKDYLGQKWQNFSDYCKDLGKRRPWVKTLYQALTHPTLIRVYALASAVAITVLTGGAVPSIVILSLTFAGSFLAVYGKAKQLYNAQKAAQQALIIEKIKKELDDTSVLLGRFSREEKNLITKITRDNLVKDEDIHKIKIKEPVIYKGVMKAVRSIGLENAVPVLSYMSQGNLPGAVFYFFSLLFTAKSEAAARVAASARKIELYKIINDLCAIYRIKKYDNTNDVFKLYLEKKAERMAIEQIVKEGTNGTLDASKFEQYKAVHLQRLHEDDLKVLNYKKAAGPDPEHPEKKQMQSASFWRGFIRSLYRNAEVVDIIQSEYHDSLSKMRFPAPLVKMNERRREMAEHVKAKANIIAAAIKKASCSRRKSTPTQRTKSQTQRTQ